MNGLVERFSGTIKCLLQKYMWENAQDWPQWLPILLFTLWEIPQASTGFPFALLVGRHPLGVLGVL